MTRDVMKFKHLPQYKGNSKVYVEGIIDEIYDDFEKQTCKNCKYNVEDYTIDTQVFTECKNENSLLYCTSLSDIYNGTHPDFGCNQFSCK